MERRRRRRRRRRRTEERARSPSERKGVHSFICFSRSLSSVATVGARAKSFCKSAAREISMRRSVRGAIGDTMAAVQSARWGENHVHNLFVFRTGIMARHFGVKCATGSAGSASQRGGDKGMMPVSCARRECTNCNIRALSMHVCDCFSY